MSSRLPLLRPPPSSPMHQSLLSLSLTRRRITPSNASVVFKMTMATPCSANDVKRGSILSVTTTPEKGRLLMFDPSIIIAQIASLGNSMPRARPNDRVTNAERRLIRGKSRKQRPKATRRNLMPQSPMEALMIPMNATAEAQKIKSLHKEFPKKVINLLAPSTCLYPFSALPHNKRQSSDLLHHLAFFTAQPKRNIFNHTTAVLSNSTVGSFYVYTMRTQAMLQ